ncbi:MAG: hypothetical protein U0264_03875 [Candidatus Kapaibacterium sp.]
MYNQSSLQPAHRHLLLAVYCLLFVGYVLLPPVRNATNTHYFLALFTIHTGIGIIALRCASTAIAARPILAWAVFLSSRLLIFPMLPWLSDDVFGYLWQGTLTLNGWNCYVYPANAPDVAYLRSPLYDLLAYKAHPAIYPPLAEMGIALGAWLGGLVSSSWQSALMGWKVVLLLAEALGFWLLLKARKHVPFFSPAFYLLLPLPVVEIMGQAHNDGLVLAPLGGLIYLMARLWNSPSLRRESLTGALLAAMTMIKLIPAVMLLPLLRLRISVLQKVILCISFGTLSVALAAVFFYDSRALHNFLEILQFYNQTQFNSPLLQLIRGILELLQVPNWWLVAPSVISVLRLSGIVMIGLMMKPVSFRAGSMQLLAIFSAATLISPKVHPWYCVPLLFLNAVVGWRWLAYGAQAMMLSYALYAVTPEAEQFVVESLVWVGVVIAMVWELRNSRMNAVPRNDIIL